MDGRRDGDVGVVWCETTGPRGWGWRGSQGCQEHRGLLWVPGQGLLLWPLSPRLDPGAAMVPAVSPTVLAEPQP